ncbi:MAG: polysaccharide deacetylase family protein [Candidatus Dadabacteria bacterium]
MKRIFLFLSFLALLSSCNSSSSNPKVASAAKSDSASPSSATATTVDTKNLKAADAATIMARQQVPILCYHHIRDLSPGQANSGYTVDTQRFKEQMKILADSGYHSILPDQLYNYLVYGTALPSKPFMITYDDTDLEQFTVGKTEMDKHGFKGVYFLMTISIGKPRYMNKEQIRQLADEGHAVEGHTWDHHRVDRYTGNDWQVQLDKPKKVIEDITGKKVDYFAFPFGVWSPSILPEIKNRGYKLAFQLGTKRDPQEPLMTVRRIIVDPAFTGPGLLRGMRNSFKG